MVAIVQREHVEEGVDDSQRLDLGLAQRSADPLGLVSLKQVSQRRERGILVHIDRRERCRELLLCAQPPPLDDDELGEDLDGNGCGLGIVASSAGISAANFLNKVPDHPVQLWTRKGVVACKEERFFWSGSSSPLTFSNATLFMCSLNSSDCARTLMALNGSLNRKTP